MKSNKFWRYAVVILAIMNLLFWLWRTDRLQLMGLGPRPVQEPYRLDHQISPELLIPKPNASAAASLR